jgi:integrase
MLVEDHLRSAAVKAGILSAHRDAEGRLVDDDSRRFGFHMLRQSLASFLIRMRTDPKTMQTLLRHSDVKLTFQFYTQPGSHGRSRENAHSASQPRGGPKRTEPEAKSKQVVRNHPLKTAAVLAVW